MIGLGTAINIGLIIAGSLCGLAFGRFMKENLKQTLMMVSGIIVLLLGMSGAMQYMLVIVNGTIQTTGPMLMIISMVAGAVIGELIDLNRWITVFGDWVKAKGTTLGADDGIGIAAALAVLTDENIEILRDSCIELRDVAMIDLLSSTGMRVGELVKMNRDDIDFQERQCV